MEFSLLIIGSLLILHSTKADFINCGKIMEYLRLKLIECSVLQFTRRKECTEQALDRGPAVEMEASVQYSEVSCYDGLQKAKVWASRAAF